MRKFLGFVMVLTITLPLVSCSFPKNSNDATANTLVSSSSSASANEPGTGSSTSANEPVNTSSSTSAEEPANSNPASNAETSGESAAAPSENTADNGITLESVKKAAQDAGYTPEDIQEIDVNTDPSPTRGIFINYKDENSQSQSPVYEFKSPEDAQKFAVQVNKEGYSLSIVNGKLVTMTGSKYGVVYNEKERSVLETLLQSKVMAYEEPVPPQASSSKDYAGACSRIDAIYKALDKLVNKSVLVYSKSLPEGDPNKNIGTVTFSMLSSPDMSFTSSLCEDQTKLDEFVKNWESFGVKLKHGAANDYTLTGKRAGLDTSYIIHCVYSPDKDSLRILDKDGGEAVELLEFVPLGQDKYAFQTLYERAIIEYKDGKITSFVYSVKTRTKETAYNPDKESIYPEGKGAGNAWVSKLGEDKYEQFTAFDGASLKISATDFTGKKLKLEIGVK